MEGQIERQNPHLKSPAIKRGWMRSLIYLISLFFVLIIFGLPALIVASVVSGKPAATLNIYEEGVYVLIAFQAIVLTGVTGLTVMFARHIDRRDLITLGFGKFRRNKDLLLGLALGFAVISLGFAILYISGKLEIRHIDPDFSFLAGSVVLCVLISWMEEISFRGYILNNFLESFSPLAGLLVSSLLFAGFHMFNPGMSFVPFLNLFLAGILLGIVFIYTRTIWYALSLHFSWNFFQGPVFGFRVSGIDMGGLIRQEVKGDELITGGGFGFEGSILCSLIIILCIFALNRYFSRMSNRSA